MSHKKKNKCDDLAVSTGGATSEDLIHDFFILPNGGNDRNSGRSATTALRTLAELQRRIDAQGGTLEANGVIQIFIPQGLPSTDPIGLRAILIRTTVVFIGTGGVVTVRAGTIAAVTPRNQLTNTPWDITDPTAAGLWGNDLLDSGSNPFAPGSTGHRLRLTSGNVNSIAWGLKEVAAGTDIPAPGGPTLRTSEWTIQAPPNVGTDQTGQTTILGPPAVGDTYAVEKLPEVTPGVVDVITGDDPWGPSLIAPQPRSSIWFVDLDFVRAVIPGDGVTLPGNTSWRSLNIPIYFSQCHNNCVWRWQDGDRAAGRIYPVMFGFFPNSPIAADFLANYFNTGHSFGVITCASGRVLHEAGATNTTVEAADAGWQEVGQFFVVQGPGPVDISPAPGFQPFSILAGFRSNGPGAMLRICSAAVFNSSGPNFPPAVPPLAPAQPGIAVYENGTVHFGYDNYGNSGYWGQGNFAVPLEIDGGCEVKFSPGVPPKLTTTSDQPTDFTMGAVANVTSQSYNAGAGTYNAPVADTWANLQTAAPLGGLHHPQDNSHFIAVMNDWYRYG